MKNTYLSNIFSSMVIIKLKKNTLNVKYITSQPINKPNLLWIFF